ncbi:MAG: exodeoxyribonuclease VII small subunit [Granulosicoccus sp.]
MSKKIPKSTRFEDALKELESIVESLESGDQSLEQSLERFERGVALSRFCQHSLDEAEQKVQILMKESDDQNSEESLVPLDKGSED